MIDLAQAIRRLSAGKPDAFGDGPDPGTLRTPYTNFEEVACLSSAGPRNVTLMRLWDPLHEYLFDGIHFGGMNHWEQFREVQLALLLSQAGIGSIFSYENEEAGLIQHLFQTIPEDRQQRLFGIAINDPLSEQRKHFRRTFRVRWRTANWDEVIPFDFTPQGDIVEAHIESETALTILNETLDMRHFARGTAAETESILRSYGRERNTALTRAYGYLWHRRLHLTGFMKALIPKSERR